jgi:hypothetical protein
MPSPNAGPLRVKRGYTKSGRPRQPPRPDARKPGRKPGRPQGRCICCNSPSRVEAEILLARGVSCQKVAAKYSLPYSSLLRHWARHVSELAKAEMRVGDRVNDLKNEIIEESESVRTYLQRVRLTLFRNLEAADVAGDKLNVDRMAHLAT